MTIIPTRVYLKNGRAKLEIALARGKRSFDKREAIARRDRQREMPRNANPASVSEYVMEPTTIGGINRLPEDQKRKIYTRVIPHELLERFHLPEPDSIRLQTFLNYKYSPGSSDVELSLFHEQRFPDPILYGHLTDTMNGQIHVLLYILNDPDSPRFDVDHMPDGRKTRFGTLMRNHRGRRSRPPGRAGPGSGPKRAADAVRGDCLF